METTEATVGSIFPALRYADANAALEWLQRAFGFTPHSVYRDSEGQIAHAEIRLGNGIVMFGTQREDGLGTRTPADAGGVTQTIYAYVEDPDAHYRQARDAGAEIVYEIYDTAYGSREYAARDPEGHLWNFGSYLPGAEG